MCSRVWLLVDSLEKGLLGMGDVIMGVLLQLQLLQGMLLQEGLLGLGVCV